jgi:hypothetical protein
LFDSVNRKKIQAPVASRAGGSLLIGAASKPAPRRRVIVYTMG